jgi:hypothetical protein
MEDIEDLLIGTGAGTPPGFRSPLTSVTVGFGTKKNQRSSLLPSPSPSIPGTQVLILHLHLLFHLLFFFFFFHSFLIIIIIILADYFHKNIWMFS